MEKPFCWLNSIKTKYNWLKTGAYLLVFLFLYSCDFGGKNDRTDEGTIEYAITYPDTSNTRFDSNMRPEKLTVKFKGKKTLTNIQGLSGAVSLSFINNINDNSSIVLVKLFNKKLCYTENYGIENMPLVYSQMPKLIIEPTSDTVESQGFKCAKSIGSFHCDPLVKFEILSTNEFGVEYPNEKTPYTDVNGLLMAFTIKLYGQTMSLKALNVTFGKLSNSDFEIPKDYEIVTKETIIDIFSLMQ